MGENIHLREIFILFIPSGLNFSVMSPFSTKAALIMNNNTKGHPVPLSFKKMRSK